MRRRGWGARGQERRTRATQRACIARPPIKLRRQSQLPPSLPPPLVFHALRTHRVFSASGASARGSARFGNISLGRFAADAIRDRCNVSTSRESRSEIRLAKAKRAERGNFALTIRNIPRDSDIHEGRGAACLQRYAASYVTSQSLPWVTRRRFRSCRSVASISSHDELTPLPSTSPPPPTQGNRVGSFAHLLLLRVDRAPGGQLSARVTAPSR